MFFLQHSEFEQVYRRIAGKVNASINLVTNTLKLNQMPTNAAY